MGSSYMDYRGSGFSVRDYQAEVWLYLLAQEAKRAIEAPAWLADASPDWEAQVTAGFIRCVSACLDEHLGTEPDRVEFVLDLSERVLRRLHELSAAIPKDLVNSSGEGEQESFNADLPIGPLLACGRAFIRLLRGQFRPGSNGWAHSS